MTIIVAKDNTTITVMGTMIHASSGETYNLAGDFLLGPTGRVSNNCSSIDEAVAIIVGMHGGRKI